MCRFCDGSGDVTHFRYGHITVPVMKGVRCCQCDPLFAKDVDRRRRHSGLHETEWSVTIDRLDPQWHEDTQKLITHVVQVMSRELMWLSIIGDTGNGKTTSLWSLTNHFAAQTIPVKYITMPEMFAYLRAGFDDPAKSTEVRLKELMDVHCLFLDEADKMTDSEWQRELLHRLVDHRWRCAKRPQGQGRKVTVFAMNAEPHDGYLRSRMLDSQFATVWIYSPDVRAVTPPLPGVEW